MSEGASATQRRSANEPPPPPTSVAQPREGHVGPSTLSGKLQYLVLYNLVSLVLWVAVFLRLVLALAVTGGSGIIRSSAVKATASDVLADTYPATSHVLMWTQTLALVEILHAASGLVRTSVITTTMQVSSRLLLVWGILSPFGGDLLQEGSVRKVANATGITDILGRWGIGSTFGLQEPVQWNQAAYAGMLIAWTLTECVRYLYFVFFLGSEGDSAAVPKTLVWLRYNTFFLLYPLGISCECWLIYHAIPFAKQLDERYAWFLWAVLAIYVPGSYVLYSHMMTQRRRTIKGKAKQKSRSE